MLPRGFAAFGARSSVLLSFQSQSPVDALHEDEDDGLPADEPPEPVKQLAVHHVWLLPRVGEHALQVDLLMAVGASLLLAHNAPATDAKLVEAEREKTE
jgi:hypothetical protein